MKTHALISGRPQGRMPPWLAGLFAGLPPLVAVSAYLALPSVSAPHPAAGLALTEENAPRGCLLPPPELQTRLKHFMQANDPSLALEGHISYISAEQCIIWPHTAGDSDRGKVWVADWNGPSLRSIRIAYEEKNSNLIFFSADADAVNKPGTEAVIGKGPTITKEEAIARAKEYLRYFRKTEWCDCPFLAQPMNKMPQFSPFGAWALRARNQGHILRMTVDRRTGGLLFLAEGLDRTGGPRNRPQPAGKLVKGY